ncbi:MAG TPA: LuxR C-terminal-related transcriptional regulator [Fimbriimonadaceae bacterium]|nr:LuxR C-terminal-related transcriptional regulator [Fimbriimonadaceae bacterium]
MSESDATGRKIEKKLGITKQESVVIKAAAKGMTDKEIAKLRGISVTSVRTYWDRLREKLHANGRTHVVAIVGRAKLLESEKARRECEEELSQQEPAPKRA